MAEANLLKEKRRTTTCVYDETKPEDLLSRTLTTMTVVYKDKDGTYPEGKIVQSDTEVLKNKYEYEKDDQGNIIGCKLTRTVTKNGQALDNETDSVVFYYDGLGRLIKTEYYTRTKVMYNREQFWYWGDTTTLKCKTIKSTDVLTTFDFNENGDVVLIVSKTLKSKVVNRKYEATYNKLGECESYIDWDKGYSVQIHRDKDHTGHILSVTKTFRHLDDRGVFSRKTKIYDPNSEYKISRVIENNMLKEAYTYNLNAELIKFVKFGIDGTETCTTIERSVDPDTEERTEETHTYITRPHKKQHSKYIKKTFDSTGKLLVYAEDNSKVTTYTYEDDKRMSATTKQLVGDNFIVIDSIAYTYTEEQESNSKTRTEERYDANGSTVMKRVDTKSETIPVKVIEDSTVVKVYASEN